MSTGLPNPVPSGATDAPRGPRRRARWQIGLRTLFLLMAAIAVWMTYYVNRRHNALLRSRIAVMRPLARELRIEDPNEIAVVKLEEMWYDENRWDIYLPDGAYRVCLATREITRDGLAPVAQSARIGSGRHLIALESENGEDGSRVVATWNGSGRLVVTEPEGWNPGHGSTGGGQFSESTQRAIDEPVILYRRIFMKGNTNGPWSTPKGPAEGILLWIERVAGPKPPA